MITRSRLVRLAEAQNWRCAYCSCVMQADDKEAASAITRDRVEPGCQGGTYAIGNVVAACKWCNNRRGDMPAQLFYEMIQRGWRPRSRRELKALAKSRAKEKSPPLRSKTTRRFRVTEDRAIWETVA